MTTDHIWIDEAFIYGQMEPTSVQTMVRLQWWEKALTTQRLGRGEALNQERDRRDRGRLKRRKTVENCMHGRLPFPIRWSQGVYPPTCSKYLELKREGFATTVS